MQSSLPKSYGEGPDMTMLAVPECNRWGRDLTWPCMWAAWLCRWGHSRHNAQKQQHHSPHLGSLQKALKFHTTRSSCAEYENTPLIMHLPNMWGLNLVRYPPLLLLSTASHLDNPREVLHCVTHPKLMESKSLALWVARGSSIYLSHRQLPSSTSICTGLEPCNASNSNA
jgi:hypothetical protein